MDMMMIADVEEEMNNDLIANLMIFKLIIFDMTRICIPVIDIYKQKLSTIPVYNIMYASCLHHMS
jgi:hypothetical protein